jgi:glycerol-3-phosphate dehydrogenase (NAD(P)+)
MRRGVAVIGAGAWGTTLADLLARRDHEVRIWALEPEVARAINQGSQNPVYLPGVALAPDLAATTALEEAVSDATVVVNAVPSQYVRGVFTRAAKAMRPDTLVISATKGLETSTHRTMADVLDAVLDADAARDACFLSGPSFALEVVQQKPTAVVVASRSADAALRAQRLFQSDRLRVYTSPDVTGVLLGGALKNVIALAAGMVAGLDLGHNALAATITRGLAEMARLGLVMGADPRTLSGLAGMGDLILTCTGELSRNRHVGIELGRGRRLADILQSTRTVAEGVATTGAAHELAREHQVDMPIVAEVHAVLLEGRHPRDAVTNLMTREPKPELR